MKIVVLLHFYQPHNQQADILDRIVNESYRPLLNGLLSVDRSRVVINIPGALTNLLVANGYNDVIEKIKDLVKNKKAALTSSAMYHAFLPLLSECEIKRQISLNNDTNSDIFDGLYEPRGFFSPEMAINEKVLGCVQNLGYKWISVPEISLYPDKPRSDMLYTHEDFDDLRLFFRNKRVSSLVLSAATRDSDELIRQTKDLHDEDKYWFVVMDAETFGHHRVGHEKFLFEIMRNDFFEPRLPMDLIKNKKDYMLNEESVKIRPSTWTNEEQDFWLEKETGKVNSKSFILWHDPDNPIHNLQWELVNYAEELLSVYKGKDDESWQNSREMLDKALASDQFWWASAKPWWSLEMIEQGAYQLKLVIKELFGERSSEYEKADGIYREILDKAFEWQREGIIRKRHLDNSSTFMKKPFKERAPEEWYNQIILEFEDEMNKACKNRDFEQAIKWRDALIKLKQGTDIYDVLHVVDELWSARNIPEVKPFLAHDWEEFSEFAKDNLKGIKTKEDFENWKKNGKL